MAESADGEALLVAEAEWSDRPDLTALARERRRKGGRVDGVEVVGPDQALR